MRRRLSPFLMICIMGGLAILSSTMSKNPALPLFIRSLGVGEATVGLIAAASTVVGIVVSIPAGVLSDVIGRRRVVLASMVVFATAPFLYLLVTAPWHLVLVRIYHGLATAILGPVAMAAVADLYDAGRGERMAWYSSATLVGRFIAPTLGGLLIIGDDFRWVYLADGVFGVLALLVALRLPRLGAAETSSSWRDARLDVARGWSGAKGELGLLFRNGVLLATSLMEAAQYFTFGFAEAYLPLYLNEQLGLATTEIGVLFTVQTIVLAVTKPFAGRLSDRVGRVPMISGGLLLCAVSMAAIAQTEWYAVLIALLALFGLGMACVTASTAAYVADLSRATTHGAALGTLSSIMDVGQSLGPILGGLLVASLGHPSAYGTVAAALAAVALVYAWRMGPAERHAARQGAPAV